MLLMLLMVLSVVGCARDRAALPGGVSLKEAYTRLDPVDSAVADLTSAAASYQERGPAGGADLADLDLKACLDLAVAHNRALRRATYAAERVGLGRDIARRAITSPLLNASYQVQEGDDTSSGSAGAIGHWAGFEVEPFISFLYDQAGADEMVGSYGVAVSRQLFRIDTERIRQYLPLTGATRDFHIALNERVLELRGLRLKVVQAFYNIQRLNMRVAVRARRETDAGRFLEEIKANVVNGLAAPVEETNATISLNQAQADLVGERTRLQNAKEVLLDLLGTDLQQPLGIREDDLTTITHARIDLPADVALVRAQHERVRNLLLAMEVRRLEFRVDLDELRPDLNATVSASRDTNGPDDDGEVSAMLNLSVPLDGYRAERARATQDRLRLLELTLDLAEIRSGLEQELRRRWRNIDQLQITARLAQERLDAEQRKLLATVKRYEAGGLDNLEVVRAKEAVDNAELSLLEARIARILEEAQYRAQLPAPIVPAVAPENDKPNDNAAEAAKERPAADKDPDR